MSPARWNTPTLDATLDRTLDAARISESPNLRENPRQLGQDLDRDLPGQWNGTLPGAQGARVQPALDRTLNPDQPALDRILDPDWDHLGPDSGPGGSSR